jgi:hypothetical protein
MIRGTGWAYQRRADEAEDPPRRLGGGVAPGGAAAVGCGNPWVAVAGVAPVPADARERSRMRRCACTELLAGA